MKLPTSKYNPEEFEIIRNASKKEIIENSKQLLEWTQDLNWPIAIEVCRRMRSIIPEIENEILEILNGEDLDWKINVMLGILRYSDDKLPNKIMKNINFILDNSLDFNEELVEACVLITKTS